MLESLGRISFYRRKEGRAGDELMDDCINQLGSIPPEPNFRFLYLSDHLANQAESILNRLKQVTDISYWVGNLII